MAGGARRSDERAAGAASERKLPGAQTLCQLYSHAFFLCFCCSLFSVTITPVAAARELIHAGFYLGGCCSETQSVCANQPVELAPNFNFFHNAIGITASSAICRAGWPVCDFTGWPGRRLRIADVRAGSFTRRAGQGSPATMAIYERISIGSRDPCSTSASAAASSCGR